MQSEKRIHEVNKKLQHILSQVWDAEQGQRRMWLCWSEETGTLFEVERCGVVTYQGDNYSEAVAAYQADKPVDARELQPYSN